MVTLRNVIVRTNGGAQAVNLTVQPLEEPDAMRGMVMLIFAEVSTPPETNTLGRTQRAPARSKRVADLERDLQHARQEVQTIREEMQTSQEELNSANEELPSANEELQSTNEELTTSREEMQSLNEELQTVNAELQAKFDELSRMNNDLKNLLDSTKIATLFLDKALQVRRFTNQIPKITKLIVGYIGRPITDIASDLFYPELAEDALEVIRSLVSIEKQVAIRGGRWYMVCIMPYRTLENMIDGVVITFTDITVSKKLEAELRKTQTNLEKRIEGHTRELEQAKESLPSDMQREKNKKGAETIPGSEETKETKL